MNRRAWQAADHGVTESDTTEHIVSCFRLAYTAFDHLSLTPFLLSPFTASPYFLLPLPLLPTQADTKATCRQKQRRLVVRTLTQTRAWQTYPAARREAGQRKGLSMPSFPGGGHGCHLCPHRESASASCSAVRTLLQHCSSLGSSVPGILQTRILE